MEIKEIQSAIEAVLFASGEPLPADKLAQALGLDKATTVKLVQDLAGQMEKEQRGVEILRLGDSYQMCSRNRFAPYVRNVLEMKRNTPLSQAAMEILAIIAYNQPVTKGFVEQIRGVDSSGSIASLVNKGLIEEKGRLELPGRPLLYGTTENFLRCFGVSSLEELPKLEAEARPEASEEPEPIMLQS